MKHTDIESLQRDSRPTRIEDPTGLQPEAGLPETERRAAGRPHDKRWSKDWTRARLRQLQAKGTDWSRAWLWRLQAKGAWHWIIVALLIPTGLLAGHALGSWDQLEGARFAIYQFLQRASPNEPTHARRTAIVLIEDKEYWRGELARRVPLKRDYLARLIRKLDLANPAVIALDVDLRAQTPDGRPADHADYRDETEKLLAAIREVSARRTIVLPQPVSIPEERGSHEGTRYEREPTVFDGVDFRPGKVKTGYTALPPDLRRVPLTITLGDGSKCLSFAAAIVERLDSKSLADAQAEEDDALPYGTYMPPDSFVHLSADHVLQTDLMALEPALAHQVVIVGGGWHSLSLNRGPIVDMRRTPAGKMVGAFIHGNYVEALYLGRTKKLWPNGVDIAVEVFLSLAVAILFSLDYELGKNLAITLGLCVILAILTFVAWQNLGLFFDFLVPAVLLFIHASVEQIREWKAKASDNEHNLRIAA